MGLAGYHSGLTPCTLNKSRNLRYAGKFAQAWHVPPLVMTLWLHTRAQASARKAGAPDSWGNQFCQTQYKAVTSIVPITILLHL